MKANKLTFSALICAFCLVFMITAGFIKTGTLAIYCILSMLLMINVDKCGVKYAFFSYIAAAGLSLLLPVSKNIAISFICFFGIYPIIKFFAERQKNASCFIIKFICFNISFAAIYFFITELITSFKFNIIIIFIGANAAFLIYDIFLSYAYSFYMKNIKKLIK